MRHKLYFCSKDLVDMLVPGKQKNKKKITIFQTQDIGEVLMDHLDKLFSSRDCW